MGDALFNDFLIGASFSVKALISIILGGLIGLEREFKNKPAGFKTHMFIALGATIFTFISISMTNGDPGRIAAQIVSGVGFIGGGAILQLKKGVLGLTTAATIWVAAAIGMLVGAGMMIPAYIATFVCLIGLVFADRFGVSYNKHQHYSLSVEVMRVSTLQIIEDMIKKFGLMVDRKKLIKGQTVRIEISYTTNPMTQYLFIKRIFRLKGVGEVLNI